MSDPQALLEHATWLRRLARTLVADSAVADDLVQDTYLAALRRPPGGAVKPWLRTVVTNFARFRWRSDAHRGAREQGAAALDDDAAPSSDVLLERHQTQQLLARLVGELEEPFRTTILLRYGEGLTPKEIARRAGIPAGTVRWRLKEAHDRLRVRLDAAHRGDRRAWIAALAPLASTEPPAAPIAVGLAALSLAIMSAVVVVWIVVLPGERPAERHALATPHDRATTPAVPRAEVAMPSATWGTQEGAPARHLVGRVTSEGQPAAGALVRLTSELVPAREVRTGVDGRFDFGVQEPRGYTVSAASPGRLAAIRHVDLRDPTLDDVLELELLPCPASLYGRVTDAAGSPIAGAHVLREGAIGAETDGAGSYELCALPTAASLAEIRLVVEADGYGGIAVFAAPSGRVRRDFMLSPEAVVAGRVVAPDGTPAASVKVWLEPDLVDTDPPGERSTLVAAQTDGEGRFRITGVAGGPHRLFAAGRASSGGPIELAVAPGETRDVEVVARSAGILRGRVTQGGVPVAGIRVEASRPTWLVSSVEMGGSAISQQDGSFVLDRLPLGPLKLATSPARIRTPDEITVVDSTSVEIEVEPLATLSGVVRRHGIAIPFARVDIAGPSRAEVTADASGNYVAAGLVPGTYAIYADDRRRGAAVREDGIEVATDQQHDIELAWGGRISGIVVDGRGAPVPNAHVVFVADDEGRCVTAGDGAFSCGSLRGGSTYKPQVFAGDAATNAFRFVSPATGIALADGNAHVEGVRLAVDPAVSSISGTVVDGDHEPIVDAHVIALGDEPPWVARPSPSGLTDRDGRFRIDGLPAGDYELVVQMFDRGASARAKATAGARDVSLVVEKPRCDAAGVHDVPSDLTAPRSPVVWNRQIELVGWRIPAHVRAGTPFEVAIVYRVLGDVTRTWKPFVHLDGPEKRHNADHEPASGRCPTSTWRAGDVIVDRFTVTIAETYPRGRYEMWTGFFTGWGSLWKNLTVTDAPEALRGDPAKHPDAVHVTDIVLDQ
ncbi:MAG: sigma-70 family RNA polymerase sigma factor [Kofleriaceae bacterium]|nr:sigma-70 family RNA polymerase sigma factor [Kofleriaceae bacterium]